MTLATIFREWDDRHPEVWVVFRSTADEGYASGLRRWSADAVLHLVRWSTKVEINNNFAAFYARKYLAERPDRRRFFELRASIADGGISPQMELGL